MAKEPQTVKIILSPSGHGSRIEINGEDLSHLVKGVTVRAAVGETTSVMLEIVGAHVEIEGMCIVDTTEAGPPPRPRVLFNVPIKGTR